jgi:CHASE3 domain sensor protein
MYEFRPPLQSEQDLERIERERMEQSGPQEQEINRLKNTTAQSVLYIVVGIALLLFLIVGILGANVFHFW